MEPQRRTYTKSVKSVDLCGSESFPRAAYKSAIIGRTRRVQSEPDCQAVAGGVMLSDGRDVERGKGQQAALHYHPFTE